MLGSGVLHAFGIVHGGLPIWVISIAMIGIGAMVGTRFATIGFAAFARYLAAGVGSLAVGAVDHRGISWCSPSGLQARRSRIRPWPLRRARWT